jgi:hypothetical protein
MLKKEIFTLIFFVLISGCSKDYGAKEQTSSQQVSLSPIAVDSLQILTGNPLWPEQVPSNYQDKINYSKESVRIGRLNIEEKLYQAAILNGPAFYPFLKYGDVSYIWVDRNQNNKYDFYEDVLEQMYLPFTIESNSYQVTQIDSSGKFIQVELCDPEKFPPIRVGLPAPNFRALTIDSSEFQLNQLNGHPIFLYFWSCNPFFHKPHIEKVVSRFSNSDLKIVCIGNYTPIVGSENSNNRPINWVHINEGNLKYETRLKYQVGGLPKLFLIDQEGIIQSINVEFMGDKLIEIVEQYLQLARTGL